MKKRARVSEKLVSPGLPGLQVATRLLKVDQVHTYEVNNSAKIGSCACVLKTHLESEP